MKTLLAFKTVYTHIDFLNKINHEQTLNFEAVTVALKTVTNKSTKQHFVDDAKRWSELDVDSRDDLFELTNVYQRIFGKEPFGSVSLFTFLFVETF